MPRDPAARLAAQNRRARFDYEILETIEAGIVLSGTEVKSLRAGQASINESYAGEKDGELFLINSYVPEYKAANRFNHEPRRVRKLLVHRRQRDRLLGSVKRDGITLVPLSIYFNERGIAKVELGLAKGRKKGDKREHLKKEDWKRDRARLMREKG